jgi:energy-coupling factor transport system substrate-specific component
VSWPLASFTILAIALAAGFAWFERSKPSSRTVAAVATLAALATLGRIAFAALPNVKPTTDIVLIAGYSLGGPPGFAVGAVAAIASNIVFGQGPWTPWQMLAWGLVGLLGAALARWPRPIPRVAMALICAAAGFGYGAILNFSTWVTFTGQHTLAQFAAIEGSAFSFDLVHAIGNLVFFLAFGPALIRVLERLRARLDVSWGLVGPASLALLAGLSVVALSARVPAANAAARGSPVTYLERAQNADGGFGLGAGQASSQLATAWAVVGLEAAGVDASRLTRDGHNPVSWMRGHLGQLQGPGDVERTIVALAAAHAPLGDLPSRLRAAIKRDGSVQEQANLTSFEILALAAAGQRSAIPAAATWLQRNQNGDGGFSFAARGDPSDVDDTAAAIEALVVAHAPTAAEARAARFLSASENRDGGFPLEPGGASDSQSTAWVIQAVVALHRKATAPLAYLHARTTASGLVDYAAGNGQTPVWVTGEALAALAGRPLD